MPQLPDGVTNRVLIVDRCDDNREVLRTALQSRGLATIEASGIEQGLRLARSHHPRVIVLDLETDETCPAPAVQFEAEARRHDGALVLLGAATVAQAGRQHRILGKPYHYAPLIRTIEQLISQ